MDATNTSEAMVYVVDDDQDVLHAMAVLFDAVGLPCRTYATAIEFLDDYQPSPSGCLVLDIRLPGMSGLELQEKLAEMRADIPIIMITAHGDVPSAVTAMKRGAFNFIEKPFRDQALLDSVNRALDVSARARSEAEERAETAARWQSLTPREKTVAALIASGKLNKTIAAELGVSRRTIEVHRARVMTKMDSKSLAALVKMLLTLGVLDDHA